MELQVYLFDKLIGILRTTSDRGIVFSYTDEYLQNEKTALSISLPLQKKEFSQKECLPYFIGLLPEGEIKRRIAQDLHVSELSTIKLLEALGGECAGSVSFYSEDFPKPKIIQTKWKLTEENYTKISKSEIVNWIKEIQNKPFIYAKNDARLSLAGAQEKISLAYFNESWYLPKNGSPSTHILKPCRMGELNTISANEFICMMIANKMGLPVPRVKLINMEENSIFICERYDRIFNEKENAIERLHQEDFCQALCIMSDNKYQVDGGPSFLDCKNLIQKTFENPIQDTYIFIESIIFNYLIGNCDCHGKNYSILTDFTNHKRLAPLYDLVSTTVYNSLTTKMAMKIGNNYDIPKISKTDFSKLAELLNVKPSFLFDIANNFTSLIEKVFSEIEQMKELENYHGLILNIKNGIFNRSQLFL